MRTSSGWMRVRAVAFSPALKSIIRCTAWYVQHTCSSNSGKTVVAFEFCLHVMFNLGQNLIRQYTYPEYYQNRSITFTDPPDLVRTHVGQYLRIPPSPSFATFNLLTHLVYQTTASKCSDKSSPATPTSVSSPTPGFPGGRRRGQISTCGTDAGILRAWSHGASKIRLPDSIGR